MREACFGGRFSGVDGSELDPQGIADGDAAIGGHSHEDGPAQRKRLGRIEDVAVAEAEAGAGRNARERVDDACRQRARVIEGQDVVVEREGEEIAFGQGRHQERCGGGVDEVAQHARKHGFAAA